ncbi:MAG: hypothetical protein JXR96_11350 [Deltaproteobacteria bacterium]|nr:hypothetical protein [Deltaproteobacteria bacterium]
MPCAALILLASLLAASDGPAGLPLNMEPVVLLGGRLRIRVPAGMRVEARRASIMAAPEAAEGETRLVLDRARARLVLMCYELFARGGEDLRKSVQADLESGWGSRTKGCKIEAVDLASPLEAIAVFPKPGEREQSANLVLAVYVERADGLVQYLAFYVNPEGLAQRAVWSELGLRMARSLSQGSREIDLSAGTRRLPGLGGPGLQIDLPAGTSLMTQPGPDFAVHHLRPVTVLGRDAGSCGVYLGHHPSFQHRQAGLSEDEVQRTPGELLGAETSWLAWERMGRKRIEAIVPHPAEKGLAVHAFCSAPDEASLKPLWSMLQTLACSKD